MSDTVSAPASAAASPTSTPATPSAPAGTADPLASTGVPGTSAAPATPPPPAKRKIKVYGQEEEYSEDELVTLAQKGRAADHRFAELSKKEKEMEAKIARLKDKPWETAKELAGVDLRQQAIQELMAEFEADQLKQKDPNAYERAQLQKELEAERAKRMSYEEARAKQEQEASDFQIQQEVFNSFSQTLEKLGERSPELVLEMIDLELAALATKRSYTADELAQHVRAKRDTGHKAAIQREYETLKSKSGEDLLAAMPPDIVKAVQGALLARARSKIGPRTPAARPVTQAQPDTGNEPTKYESDSAILRRLMRD